MTTRIPLPAITYLDAADRGDHATARACFTADAVVVDDGRTYTGDDVREFVERAGSEYSFTRDFQGFEPVGERRFVARYRLEGDFPGGVVDLRYVLTVAEDGLIERLEITA